MYTNLKPKLMRTSGQITSNFLVYNLQLPHGHLDNHGRQDHHARHGHSGHDRADRTDKTDIET